MLTPAASLGFGADKKESLVFVFLGVDHQRGVALLRPMIPPDIAVQLDGGPRQLESGTVLTCAMVERVHPAIVEGETVKVSEILFECGERKFVVKALDFSPHKGETK